jgi:anti-sigma factor RsiW
MRECASVRRLLSLYLDGEIDPRRGGMVETHLDRCAACAAEADEFTLVMRTARKIPMLDIRMPDAVRNRIAAAAAERSTRGIWGWLPLYTVTSFRPGLVATAAAILLALVAVPVAMRNGAAPGRLHDVPTIRITTEGDAVRLAWTDGSHESYKVYKSTDPMHLAQAEVHVVKGNVWVDSHPGTSPIVFYKIE